ncbi:MAG: aldo/keto reductase [Planctomycetales bacterium]|nr:aldo/keto reductase [Planctomycetales bacterium]
MEKRALGNSGIEVTPVALGCWPISGMTSVDVNPEDSRRTLLAAFDQGINFFDTAFCYGRDGESERLIGDVLRGNRDRCVIATKAGIHWKDDGSRAMDASPARIRSECETSLRRLGMDHVDLLYLHAPDGVTPIEETAAEFAQLKAAGLTRSVGVSNLSLADTQQFHEVCPLAAVQPAYNMLLRGIESELVPWCCQHGVAVVPYWPLMKGLLAGKLARDHVFQPGDGRPKYAMFRGEEWQKNQDLLDELRTIATSAGKTVAQLVVNWTINQPGITAALCGAKRAYQIEETAGATGWTLTADQQLQLAAALQKRGKSVEVSAV